MYMYTDIPHPQRYALVRNSLTGKALEGGWQTMTDTQILRPIYDDCCYFARASGSEVLQSVCLYHATMYTIIVA